MLVTIGYILLCILMFSLAIAIHEFGHFIVALKLGLKVERFSIGFGPAIWKKTYKGVEYRISCIPLGGYVSIPDVDPEGTKKLEGGASEAKAVEPKEKIPAWKEFLVALAGPMMNVVLAIILAVVLWLLPSAKFGETGTEIGGFAKDSVAYAAGLREGDIVTKVGGHPVSTWSEMQTEVQITDGRKTVFEVLRPKATKRELELKLTPSADEAGTVSIGADCRKGIPTATVDGFWEESAAREAGLCVGDRIVSAGGKPVWSVIDVIRAIDRLAPKAALDVEVLRGEERLPLSLPTVEAKQKIEGEWMSDWFIQATCPTNDFAAILTHVETDGLAASAGMKKADRIVSVAGNAVASWKDVERELASRVGQETAIVVARRIPSDEREYETLSFEIAPRRTTDSGPLLIEAMSVPSDTQSAAWMPDRNPLKQLAWDAGAIFRVLKALVTPKEAKATGKAIGGPVLIAEGIYRSTRNRFSDGVGFLRFLNTNLAVMNLLPIPVLDGGLILFALIAMIFRRRIPEKIISTISTGFMYLLLAGMAFLIYRDTVRSWKIHTAENPAEKVSCIVPEGSNAI